ncbi:MAG: hypothetical protein ACYDCY_11450 [Metallibacterium sp.]
MPCFLDDEDRARYRQLPRAVLLATGCQLHAYALMDNHVHLLATPPRFQCPPPPHRHAVGGPLQSLPGRQCRLSAALRALHRPQPGARPHDR